MKLKLLNALLKISIIVIFIAIFPNGQSECLIGTRTENVIELPQAKTESETSIESTLLKRRSVRRYSDEPLSLDQISQLLWAAQGITDTRGFRTSPSAGALYPLEIYIVVGNVIQLPSGIYRYDPSRHGLVKVVAGDQRSILSRAALNQRAVKKAPLTVVFAAVYRRTTSKYGQRGVRYVVMEIGHSAQNVCLQAVSLGLGTVTIGAFNEERVKKIVNCRSNEEPLYIMPVGKPKKE